MPALTYQNPVWPGYFADPFVLLSGSTYYAYGTGPADDRGNEIPVLRSSDLVHWEPLGGALPTPRDIRLNNYWAPEVAEKDGLFFLFYSASSSGSDEDQRLRVALCDNPAGPFRDSGKLLLPDQGFTIDASPFTDPKTGKFYLFFATDFVEQEPIGTGLCVIELAPNMTATEGGVHLVLRASADWQIYEKNRNYKGRLWSVWNCVEGPFVVFHDNRYWCFYSGGSWRGAEYGVEFAVADHPLGPWRDESARHGPTVLKAVPGQVTGPGHASVVMGPDGQQLFMVYHSWDRTHTVRRMCIDPIQWTPEGPRVDGPSTEVTF
jgi:beta-xylosidase